MITISKITSAIGRFFEAMAKARVNSELLRMGRERTEALGYSYDALRIGPSAWPWRKTNQDSAAEQEIRQHIANLDRYTDRQLADMGVSRNDIDRAVRHGRPGIDFGKDAA